METNKVHGIIINQLRRIEAVVRIIKMVQELTKRLDMEEHLLVEIKAKGKGE